MRTLAIVAMLLTLAACSTTGVGNAYTDYKRTSFEVGVNHCLHNTVLPCR